MKKFITGWIICFLLVYAFCPYITLGGTDTGTEIVGHDKFIDDVGNMIEIKKPCRRIISLFDEHTENIYHLGQEEKLIGVSDTSVYPAAASRLPEFRCGNNADAEKILKLKPDVVLSAPEINRKYPAFITKLETNGIFVISLRPDSPEEFDIYIRKLGIITDCREEAEKQIDQYHRRLDDIADAVKNCKAPEAFVESSESGYLTPSVNTLPYAALKTANVRNAAEDKLKHREEDKDVYFGMKNLQKKKDSIDYYFLLRGGGNSAASIDSAYQKKEFNGFRAYRENRVYEMSEKILDSYTFRYPDGVLEIARMCHPEVFTDISEFISGDVLTRGDFALMTYRYLNLPLYVNTNKDYYNYERYNHLYGTFRDVSWLDEDFDAIETVVSRKYMDFGPEEGLAFEREKPVSRLDIAKFIYICCDIEENTDDLVIKDLTGKRDDNAVKKACASGLMSTENGYFRPYETMTKQEFAGLLEKIKEKRGDNF